MNEPYISPAFDMDDIRRLRDYNSERHSKMTHAEIIADIEKDSNAMLRLIAEHKKSKGIQQ